MKTNTTNVLPGKTLLYFAIAAVFVANLRAAEEFDLRLQATIESSIEFSSDIAPFFSADGATIGMKCKGSNNDACDLVFWNAKNGRIARQYQFARGSEIFSLKSSRLGKSMLIYGRIGPSDQSDSKRRFELWDWNSLCKTKSISLPRFPKGYFKDMAISDTEAQLAYIIGTEVTVLDCSNDGEVCSVNLDFEPKKVCFSSDEKFLIIGGYKSGIDSGSRISFLEIETGEIKHVSSQCDPSLLESRPNSLIYTASLNKPSLIMWNPRDTDNKIETSLGLDVSGNTHCAFRADGLFAVDRDAISILRIDEANQASTFTGDTSQIGRFLSERKIALSPKADLLAVSGKRENSNKWEIQLWSFSKSTPVDKVTTLSRLDQHELEQQLDFSGTIDMQYLTIIARGRYPSWKKDSAAGCKYGKFLHGLGLLSGFGGVKNDSVGRRLIGEAAADGNAFAKIFLASNEMDQIQSHSMFEQAAQTKEPFAIEYLASRYRNGTGVEKSVARAFELSLEAATSSEPLASAMVSVGNSYLNGEGVTPSSKDAIQWFEKAAQMGHPEGCVQLGRCYLEGKGVELEPSRALEYFGRASRLGSRTADMMYAFCLEEGLGCEQDLHAALMLYETLDKLNVPTARACAVSVKMRINPPKVASQENANRTVSLGELFYRAPSGGIRYSDQGAERLRQAQAAAYEAQRDFRSHIGQGAAGILPLYP